MPECFYRASIIKTRSLFSHTITSRWLHDLIFSILSHLEVIEKLTHFLQPHDYLNITSATSVILSAISIQFFLYKLLNAYKLLIANFLPLFKNFTFTVSYPLNKMDFRWANISAAAAFNTVHNSKLFCLFN